MCGRYTIYHSADEIPARFAAETVPLLEPRYNVAPSQSVPAVTQNGGRHLTVFRWG